MLRLILFIALSACGETRPASSDDWHDMKCVQPRYQHLSDCRTTDGARP